MKLKLQLIIESDSGETEVVQELAKLGRHSLRPEDLGSISSIVLFLAKGSKWRQTKKQILQVHGAQPLMQPSGLSCATFLEIPASAQASTTLATSL